MHKTVLKNSLNHTGMAFGHRIERHKLSLHIRGEGGIGCRAQADSFWALPFHIQPDSLLRNVNVGTGFFKLGQHRIQRIGARIAHQNTAASSRCRHQKSATFDTIRHNGIFTAVKGTNTLNHNGASTVPRDICPHCDQALGQINDLWLASSVLKDSCALCQRCRHHEVFSARHRDHIHHDTRPFETRGPSAHVATLYRDIGAHRTQSPNVNINRTAADSAAARK